MPQLCAGVRQTGRLILNQIPPVTQATPPGMDYFGHSLESLYSDLLLRRRMEPESLRVWFRVHINLLVHAFEFDQGSHQKGHMKHVLQSALSVLPRELILILSCLRTLNCERESERLRMLVRATKDWERVLTRIDWHKVAPLVYLSLRKFAWDEVPELVQHGLRNRYEANTLGNLAIAAETAEISELLDSRGIPAIVLKGVAAALSVYGSLSLRAGGDIDLLLAPEHFPAAETLLRDRGYAKFSRYPQLAIVEAMRARVLHHFVYVSQKQGFQVELHLRAHLYQSIPSVTFESAFETAEVIMIGNRPVRSLAPEHNLIYLLVHGSLHEWRSLFWLCDIAEISRNVRVDWSDTMAQTERLRAVRPFLLGMVLANLLLDSPLPAEMEQRFTVDPLFESLFQHVLDVMARDDATPVALGEMWRQVLYWTRLFPGARYKTEVILKSLITTHILSRVWDRFLGRK
jgi:hypothetical protein